MSPTGLRVLAATLGTGAVLLVAVAVRVRTSGVADLQAARACREAGLLQTAVDMAGRAARWQLPIGGVSREARELLRDLAEEASTRGDPDLALRAWQGLRGSILGSRWLRVPDPDLLEEANRRIAQEMARRDRLPDGSPGLDEAGHLAYLLRDDLPRPWPAFLASWVFLAWVAVSLAGSFRAVTPAGALRAGPALRWGLGSLGLLLCWLVLLWLA